MRVRDLTKKLTEYKGQFVDGALDQACPCRPCYHPHDFSYVRTDGVKVKRFLCLTNYAKGCPTPLPEPNHIFKKGRCSRCGMV